MCGVDARPSPPSPRLLVVEADEAVRALLAAALRDAGYALLAAVTPPAARALLAAWPVDLLVLDLGPRRTDDPLAAARALRAATAPRPVGLLAPWAMVEEDDLMRQGFAFALPLPCDLNALLLRIAASLARPLSPAQQRQARVVERYFAALSHRDWDGLAALCTEDVAYLLPPPAPFAAVIQGRAAFRAYTEETYRHFPLAQFTNVRVYALPEGLVARYRGWWRTAAGSSGQQDGAVVFAFAGDHIAQIGVQLDGERLRALLAGGADGPGASPREDRGDGLRDDG